MRALLTVLFALTLCHARRGSTAAAGLQQTLQGLLSGNANQDQAVREAYERGYQRGREDEARLTPRSKRHFGAFALL